jgi:hypothetical protein
MRADIITIKDRGNFNITQQQKHIKLQVLEQPLPLRVFQLMAQTQVILLQKVQTQVILVLKNTSPDYAVRIILAVIKPWVGMRMYVITVAILAAMDREDVDNDKKYRGSYSY